MTKEVREEKSSQNVSSSPTPKVKEKGFGHFFKWSF